MKEISSNLYTLQEHETFGSTVSDKYRKNPYIPLDVIDEKISVEECNKIRQSFQTYKANSMHWGVKTFGLCVVRLSELNLDKNSSEYGQTINDPIFLDTQGELEEDLDEFMTTVPYRRTKEILIDPNFLRKTDPKFIKLD